jgi:leader peptidase (prepilin peptidase)/N-methyltransferase
MIILDEVLVVSTLLIIVLYIVYYILVMDYKVGLKELMFNHVYPGIGAFVFMYALKFLGDKLFSKESLGGGDIKLMFLFGLVLGFPLAICTVFLATFIAFPIALILLFVSKDNIIPFGPFLSMSGIIILISRIDFNSIIQYLVK